MDTGQFRVAFPEFSDIARYTDSQILFWSTLAEAQVKPHRWGSMATVGVYLYVAHELTLSVQNQAAANIGGTPGQISGPINSKTVGSVSVAYDTQQAAEKGNSGHWNLTAYGKQFIRLARIFGAGAVQL